MCGKVARNNASLPHRKGSTFFNFFTVDKESKRAQKENSLRRRKKWCNKIQVVIFAKARLMRQRRVQGMKPEVTEKITTGITGLWQPSVHSDVAF